MLFTYRAMRPADEAGRRMLYVAGAFNFIAGLGVAALVRIAPGLIGLTPPAPSQLMFIDLFIGLVVSFGVGYTLAARDLTRFWPYVALGAPAKAIVVMVTFVHFAFGDIGPLFPALVCGDAIFAVLFYRVLARHAAA